MNLRILNIITCLFITACIVTSCLNSDEVEYELNADASITAFSISDIETKYKATLDGKDTTLVAKVVGTDYPFVIDQNLGLIYNLDSLPVGTDISKIVAKITADGAIFIAAEKDSIWDEKDSLDFKNPIQFKVMSQLGTYGRTYTAKVNVHQQDPNAMSWGKLEGNFSTMVQKQKAIYYNQQVLVFAEQEDQVYMTSTHQEDGREWTELQVIDIPVKADYTSVIVWKDALYILANNELYQSSNGLNWTKTATEQKLNSIIACIDIEDEQKLFGITTDNIYTESTDGIVWENHAAISEDFPQAIYHYASYSLNTNKNIHRTVVMGQNNLISDTVNVVWSKLSDEHEWTELTMDENPNYCPNLRNTSMIYYNDQLYVFGGPGKSGSSAKAFDYFYTSKDNGIGWSKVTEKMAFPEEFNKLYSSSNGNYSFIVDDKQFIWIMWGSTGEVWKGRINKLGFVNQ